jgi:5-methylcytosine-specific restriction endonuclease McrA
MAQTMFSVIRRRDYERNPKLCILCGKSIPYKSRRGKFCSKSCGNRNRKVIHMCVVCGKETSGRRYEYCQECRRIKQIENKIRNKIKMCGKTIRKYYLNKKEHKCDHCGNALWLNVAIPLEIHHIDGNVRNNAPENIEILCLNCHALTDTYKVKNRKVFNNRHTIV